jgi:hypothetical protein
MTELKEMMECRLHAKRIGEYSFTLQRCRVADSRVAMDGHDRNALVYLPDWHCPSTRLGTTFEE